MNKFLALLFGFLGRKADNSAERYCETSPTKEHQYEWGGRYLIPAKSIKSFSRLTSRLKCHHCDATVGPQNGEFLSEEV